MKNSPKIGLLTSHWPKGPTDSAGVFVKRWSGRFDNITIERGLGAAWRCDIIAAHWLRWSGVIGFFLSVLHNKPLWLILYGDPFMIQRHWWVRVISKQIINHAAVVQVLSPTCEEIVRQYCPRATIVRIPCV